MANCFNHGDREGAFRCAVCGKSVCEECVVQENGSNFCSAACKEKAAAMTGRSDAVIAEKAKTNSATFVRKLIYFFIVVAVIAAAYYFLSGEKKKSLEQKLQRSVQTVQKETKGLVKEAKKAVPTSSKLKRQKESLVK